MNCNSIVIEHIVVGPIQTNCYIVHPQDSMECIVADPGADAERILSFIDRKGLTVKGILLTHGHFDHILGLKELKEKVRTEVYIGEEEKQLLADANMNCSIIGAGVAASCSADYYLKDGQSFELARMQVKYLHTPGHTKGSGCYYFQEAGFVLSGDTIFLESLGRTDLPTGNDCMIMQSIENKLMTLPETVLLFPGHGSETSVGYEKKNNMFLR